MATTKAGEGCSCDGDGCELLAGDPRHGSTNAYANYGCRCAACRSEWALNQHRYRQRHPEQIEAEAQRKRVKRAEAKRLRDLAD